MITTTGCECALLAFVTGVHQPRDSYRMALYGSDATLNAQTRRYEPQHECVGTGYQAGGILLSGYRAKMLQGVACLTFTDPTWDRVSIKVAGALIYNASKNNAALGVIRFDRVWVPHNGEFTPNLPAFTAKTALIRLGVAKEDS